MKAFGIAAVILTLTFASVTSTKGGQQSGTTNTGCNRDLLQTYSLTGLDIPVIDKIEMCPSITRTCCLKQDQQIIFTNFIHGGEYQAIVDYYAKVVSEYYSLIEKLIEVQKLAKIVKGNIVKKVANCKLLAERILNYEVEQIKEQVRQNLAKLQDFFQTAYSGFYCTICNFDNHKYFDSATQTVFFSEKFCRDIVENVLHTLLLFHVDIVKHANLVTKFISSCDFTGTYNLDAIPPPNYAFSVVNENMQNLQACRDNRNKREWFSYCKDICTNFNFVIFAEYFNPNLKLIAAYNQYLGTQLNLLQAAQNSRPLFGALSTPNGNKRVLQETKVVPIFKPGLSAKIDLPKWKSEFLSEGIALYDEGKNSLINENTYNSVKTFLQILSSQNANKGTNLQGQAPVISSSTQKPRKLNSGFIVNAFVAGLALLFAH